MLIEHSSFAAAIAQIHEGITDKCRIAMNGNPWNETQAWNIAKAQGKLEFQDNFHAEVERLIILISKRIKQDEATGKDGKADKP